MTATDPIERVVLTHLQIPLKEPFRISGGEVADQGRDPGDGRDGLGHRARARARRWPRASAIPPTRRKAAGTTSRHDRPQPARPIGRLARGDRGDRLDLDGQPVRRRPAPRTPLWDLLGQAHHATIAELLGAIDEQISLGVQSGLAVGLYPSIVELLKTIETHLDEGYRRVKIKIQPGSDVELVRAVRQHFGEIPLMVDANGAYTVADIDVFRELDDFDLLMFEQPMTAADLDGLAALQQAVTTPVCLDETAETLEQTAEAIDRGACRIVNLKIQRVGGLGPGPGDPRPLPPARHRLLGRLHARAGHRPGLSASTWRPWPTASIRPTSSPAPAGSSTTTSSRRSSCRPPGSSAFPTRPGLGFQVDPIKVRRYQVRQEEFTARTAG